MIDRYIAIKYLIYFRFLFLGIACVVVEGSGRAADIIGYAHKNAIKNSKT